MRARNTFLREKEIATGAVWRGAGKRYKVQGKKRIMCTHRHRQRAKRAARLVLIERARTSPRLDSGRRRRCDGIFSLELTRRRT